MKAKERRRKGEDGGGRGSPRAATPAVQGAAFSSAAAAEAGAQTSSPSTPAERNKGLHTKERDPRPPLAPGAGTARSALAADGQLRLPSPRPSRAVESALGAPLSDSPTAPCPSSWRNLRRLRPSGCSAVRLSALSLGCPTSRWLADGLAAPRLCLRRCRHCRAPL